ncbi:MAG: glycosyltransferase family 2 protein [gamma proteobacterium symbiont of Phacoides pectinatus]
MRCPLSVFIITKNESRCIGKVIDSVKEIADEVVVVDSGSSDETCQIAALKGAKVIHHSWVGYGAQKRFSEEQCCNDWLLNLDADEVVSENLRDEIEGLFRSGRPALNMYSIKVTTVYSVHDKPRIFAEYNRVIRLYDRRRVRFPDHPTWDSITPPKHCQVGNLKGVCFHYSSPGLDHYVSKFNRYTTLQAETLKGKPNWVLMLMMVLAMSIDFIKSYFFKRHVTGGGYGFVLSVTYAYSRFLKRAKQYERRLMDRGGSKP